MIRYDETREQFCTTQWEDVIASAIAWTHGQRDDFNIGELANVLWHYGIPSRCYYHAKEYGINTGAIEGCVIVPHTQYVLRDKLTGGAVIVSGYTPPLPLEWFFSEWDKACFSTDYGAKAYQRHAR